MNLRTVSEFFECSLGLSAWKQYGESTWSLRCNPSSGNLHPTEGYLVCGALEGIGERPAIYHYAPRIHALERRHELGCIIGANDTPAGRKSQRLQHARIESPRRRGARIFIEA
jgi:nitroreductase